MYFTKEHLKVYLGTLLVLQVFTLVSGLVILRTPHGHYIDFRTLYTAGHMLRTHQAPLLYDYATEQRLQSALVSPESRALPMMSAPFTALLFVPLSRLPFQAAHAVFAAINIALLVACIALLQPFLSKLSARWKAAPALLFLTFFPAALALIMGQISIILLLLYCACFVALRRRRDLLAGFILSIAMMKFQVALPVAFLFLLWRQWRFFAGFLTGAIALTGLSIRIVGYAAFAPYLRSLFSMTRQVTADHNVQARLGILPHEMPNLFGLGFVLSNGAAWSRVAVILGSAALFVWIARQRPSLPLALCTALLVSYHLFFYDLTLLLLPVSLIFDCLLRRQRQRGYRVFITQISLAAILLLPVIRFFVHGNETFWVAVPILGIVLCSPWWPELYAEAAPEPLPEPALELPVTT